jgi:hypothetical protein
MPVHDASNGSQPYAGAFKGFGRVKALEYTK